MSTHLIYWPMLAVLVIPIFVLLLNAKRKAVERNAGNVHPDAAIDNTAWSLPVVLTSNALANQFQLPVVFYVLCFILVNLNAVNILVLVLCWGFAALRWLHVIVHVTSNAVPLRLGSFLASSLMLLALFLTTLMTLTAV